MNIRARLNLWMGTLLAATVLAAGAAIFIGERRALASSVEASRAASAFAFAQAGRDALMLDDELAAMNAAVSAARAPGVVDAYLVDAAGRVRAHGDVSRLGGAEPTVGDDRLRVAASEPLGRRDKITAVLLFSRAAAEAEFHRAWRAAARRIGGMTLVVLAAGMFGAAFLARQFTEPLRRIAEGTRRIAEGRLDHRLAPERRDEIGRLAEDFNRMAARLGEVDEMKRDFVSHVTHELRSPLSAIESYVNQMTDAARAGRSDRLVEHLSVVRNNATRLGHFIDDVLDVSKLEAGRAVLRREPVPVDQALEDVVALFAAKAKEKGVTLGRSESPGLRVSADPDKLQQILVNLVGNALKFTPSGGSVALSGRSMEGGVRIDVADTGPGIPPGERERIFDRFEQVRADRDKLKGAKGTGLGLTIARGLAEAHGGRLMVEGGAAGGSVFSLWLPA